MAKPRYKNIYIYFGCKRDKTKTDTHQPKNIKVRWYVIYEYVSRHFEEKYALDELDIYGSARLGVLSQQQIIIFKNFDATYSSITGEFTEISNMKDSTCPVHFHYKTLQRGYKLYEMSNHLGNVLVVITDKRTTLCANNVVSGYEADVISATDYSAFGAPLPGRTFSSPTYRYGFNGKEKIDPISGEGNSYDFGARVYNSRLGRWFSVDPLQANNVSVTPYNFCVNNPVIFIDPDGLTNIIYIVNVPDATGKLTISNEDLTKKIAELNQYASDNKLNIKYTLFDDAVHKEGDPAPAITHLPISKQNLDNTDAVILIGQVEDVKRYDRDNNLTGKTVMNKVGDGGWTGVVDDINFNPERTDPESKVGYLDGKYIARNANGVLWFKFLALHSTGHDACPYKDVDDHIYKLNGEPAPFNIMNGGDVLDALRSFDRKNESHIATDKKYLAEALTPKNNSIFFDRVKARFNSPKPIDRYQANKKTNNDKGNFKNATNK